MATALLAACRTRLLTSTRTTSLFSSYQTRLFCSSSNGCSEARQEEKKSSHPSTASQGDSTNLHEKLCEATLAKVSEHGWTAIAIEAALDDLQLSPASASLLPAGIASVADYLDMSCNTRLARHLFSLEQYHHQKQQQPKPSTDTEANSENTEHESDANGKVDMFLEDAPTRAAYAMHYRLTLLDDYHQFWYQAVALRARLPREALRNRLLLADEIAAFANYNSPNVSMHRFPSIELFPSDVPSKLINAALTTPTIVCICKYFIFL